MMWRLRQVVVKRRMKELLRRDAPHIPSTLKVAVRKDRQGALLVTFSSLGWFPRFSVDRKLIETKPVLGKMKLGRWAVWGFAWMHWWCVRAIRCPFVVGS